MSLRAAPEPAEAIVLAAQGRLAGLDTWKRWGPWGVFDAVSMDVKDPFLPCNHRVTFPRSKVFSVADALSHQPECLSTAGESHVLQRQTGPKINRTPKGSTTAQNPVC